MAYQYLVKAQQARPSTSSPAPLSPPQGAFNSTRNNRPPPIHPTPLNLPQAAFSLSSRATLSAKPKPASNVDTSFHPTPYPHPITSSYATPHPLITVEAIKTAHIASLTRITGLLLPIRYPNSFYTATITDPIVASLSRVAIYHDHPTSSAATSDPTATTHHSSTPCPSGCVTGTNKVVGGIRCRLERLPQSETSGSTILGGVGDDGRPTPTNLYIQTLHLLSPYRGHGVAASLLNSLLFESVSSPRRVSRLAKHYNIRTVTAHVHEANEEGLRWYLARGFCVEEGVVEGYYRRLKPSGARIVRLTLPRDNDDGRLSENTADPATSMATAGESVDRRIHSTTLNAGELKAPTTMPSGSTPQKASADEENDDDDDNDWEKVEASDEDDEDGDHHGVKAIGDSRLFGVTDTGPGGRKRKADEDQEAD